MITIATNSQKVSYGIKHYNIDTLAELATLDPNKEIMGTTAFILENSQYYMVNGNHIWKLINPYGSNSPSENIPTEIIYNGGVIV